MLNRNGGDADPFPARCEVRGCDAPPQACFTQGRLTFDVCDRHGLELRAGEPHAVEADQILIGQQCTGDLLGVHHETQPPSRCAVIELGRGGVVHQEVVLEHPVDLWSVLQILLPARFGPGDIRGR